MYGIRGKTVIITGASRGIGKAAAVLYGKQGAKVVLIGRQMASLSDVSQEIRCGGGYADPVEVDVSNFESVKEFYKKFAKKYKKLDVLINNAGVLDDALIGMVSNEQIRNTFEINAYSMIYMSQYAARLIKRAGGGAIVNTSSIIGTNGNSGQAVYGGSKAAVIGITKSLAKELAVSNIRVNAVAPGFIDTDMTVSLPEDKYNERIQSIAMGRIGSPQEVANIMLFLGSDAASYVTGQVLGVDGGMLI